MKEGEKQKRGKDVEVNGQGVEGCPGRTRGSVVVAC